MSSAGAESQDPCAEDHARRWGDLATAIAARTQAVTDDPGLLTPPERPGWLTVIGSGIETAGFTRADEALLRDADVVLYCVADPATVVWLKSLRPDAYDLYVLYDDSKKRYVTYMQMSEAMLHFVRQGLHAVVVFYGHPGVFVLSTHRAIEIARREGHHAAMRAAVSALDTLCADLGVDPSQPGMLTFEATDMLIRRRRPDTGLHLVLWQVGLIGELGYRRGGFLNRGFSLLLDYLEEHYGPDHVVVNYVGSRYPGFEATVERHSIAELREPANQERVSAISTFYLAPRHVVPADPDVLIQLGLLAPGQTPAVPAGPLRNIAAYGPREMAAFDDFARFTVPAEYHWQRDTAAARFLLALSERPALRRAYEADPGATVDEWAGSDTLTPTERTLLARRDAGAAQIAAKGLPRAADPQNERLLRTLLTRTSLSRSLLRTVRSAEPAAKAEALERWGAEYGFAPVWHTVPADLDRLMRSSPAPWTGLYTAARRQLSLLLVSGPGPNGVRINAFLDGVALTRVRYERGILTWRTGNGNTTSGYLRADVTTRGARRLVGSIWPADGRPSSDDRVVLAACPLPDAPPDDSPAETFKSAASYHLRVGYPGGTRLLRLDVQPAGLTVGGRAPATSSRDGAVLRWRGGPAALSEATVTTTIDPVSGHPMMSGEGRTSMSASPVRLAGMVPLTSADERRLEDRPRLTMVPFAWTHLVRATAATSTVGGLFIWHRWAATATSLRLVRAALREART